MLDPFKSILVFVLFASAACTSLTPTGKTVPVPGEPLEMVNKCQALKTHTYCLSPQAPAPPDSPEPWGEITAYSPEVFCASDLPTSICEGITTALLAATTEWGNYGPLEYWVLVTDEQASQALTEL